MQSKKNQVLIGFNAVPIKLNAALLELCWIACPNRVKSQLDGVSSTMSASTIILLWLRLNQRPSDIFQSLVIGNKVRSRKTVKILMQSDHAVSMHDIRHPWFAVFLNKNFPEWADFLALVSAIIRMQVRRCDHTAALLIHGLNISREILFQHCFERILGFLCCRRGVLLFAEMRFIPIRTFRQDASQHIENEKIDGGDAIESTIRFLDRSGTSNFSSEIDDPPIKSLKMKFEFSIRSTLFWHNAINFFFEFALSSFALNYNSVPLFATSRRQLNLRVCDCSAISWGQGFCQYTFTIGEESFSTC